MKKFDGKMLIIGIVHAVVVLGAYFYTLTVKNDGFTPALLHYYSILCLVIASFRWLFMYDAKDPAADVFGIGFSKRKIPQYIEGEPKMNSVMVRSYIWLGVVIIGAITLH